MGAGGRRRRGRVAGAAAGLGDSYGGGAGDDDYLIGGRDSEYPEDRDSDTDGYSGQARVSAAARPALMTVGDSDKARIAHESMHESRFG